MSVMEYAQRELFCKRKFIDDHIVTEHTLRRSNVHEMLDEAGLLKSVLKVHNYVLEMVRQLYANLNS